MGRRKSPATAGLVVVATTVLGWIGCDGLSRLADTTADLLHEPTVRRLADQALQLSGAATQSGTGSTSGAAGTNPASNYPYATAGGTAAAAQNVAVSYQPFLTIGTFNIQVFGQKKVSDRIVLDYLVDIARKFDILAIQEIRDAEQVSLPYFVDALNEGMNRYRYVVGPREGDTVSKEQIAYIYNSERVIPLGTPFIATDPQQRMSRNPYVASFQCRPVDARPPFTFTLMAVHTSPQAVALELEAIAEILTLVRRSSQEDDLILLGDLNAAPERFGRLGQLPNLMAIIPSHVPTNTAKTACYDNIVFDRLATAEFTQQYGVFDIGEHYRLTKEQTALISDHLPVWATFSIHESNSSLTAQLQSSAR